MVTKLEKNDVLLPKPAVKAATPQARPQVKTAPRTQLADELSTGKGGALRAAAVRSLAATPFSAGAAARVEGTVRAGALIDPRRLANLLPTGTAQGVAQAKTASADVVQKAKDDLQYARDPNGVATALRNEKDPAVRDEMIHQLMKSDYGTQLLQGFSNGMGDGAINQGYDDMKVVADATAHAYQTGAISDQDLGNFEKQLGPEGTEFFIQTSAIDSQNTGIGGLVDALGTQAKALGYDRASTLAWTSSNSLISSHYPTAADQQAAFGQVKSFLDEVKNYVPDALGPETRNAAELALIAASRLTAKGNGFADGELDKELKDLGPTVAGEAIARSGQVWGDGNVPGPLDVLGKSAARLAQSDSKHKDEWTINSDIAFTESPELIKANLNSADQRAEAFDVLNKYMAKHRDELGAAAHDDFQPYSLLRLPEAMEGLNRLLAVPPAPNQPPLMDRLLSDTRGQADLVQMFETVAMNPNAPKDQRDWLNTTIQSYVSQQTGTIGANAPLAGAKVGELLGLLQGAGARAVAAAKGDDQSAVKALALDFTKSALSAVAGAALSETGPIGSFVGGYAVDKILDSIFDGFGDKAATPDQVRAAFLASLGAAGVDPSAGGVSENKLDEKFGEVLQVLNTQLAAATTQEQRNAIQQQINMVEQFKEGMNAHYNTSNTDTQVGQSVSNELDQRGDQP